MKRLPPRQSAAGTHCAACGRRSPLISESLGACLDCIRRRPERVLPAIAERHALSRRPFGLRVETRSLAKRQAAGFNRRGAPPSAPVAVPTLVEA